MRLTRMEFKKEVLIIKKDIFKRLFKNWENLKYKEENNLIRITTKEINENSLLNFEEFEEITEIKLVDNITKWLVENYGNFEDYEFKGFMMSLPNLQESEKRYFPMFEGEELDIDCFYTRISDALIDCMD